MKKLLFIFALIACVGFIQPIMLGCPGCSSCTCDDEKPPVKK